MQGGFPRPWGCWSVGAAAQNREAGVAGCLLSGSSWETAGPLWPTLAHYVPLWPTMVHISAPAQATVPSRGQVATIPAAVLKARRIKLYSRTSIFGSQYFQSEMLTGAAGRWCHTAGPVFYTSVPRVRSALGSTGFDERVPRVVALLVTIWLQTRLCALWE